MDAFEKELEALDGCYEEEEIAAGADENLELADRVDEIAEDSEDSPADDDYLSSIRNTDIAALNSSLVSTGEEVGIETSFEDDHEMQLIESMFGDDVPPCCSNKCTENISKELAVQFRNYFIELSKPEQDLVILSHLEYHRQEISLQSVYDTQTRKKYGARVAPKTRVDTMYLFRGLRICQRMYLFIHNLGMKRYKALVEHFDKNGMAVRVHKNAGHPVNRTEHKLTVETITAIVQFIVKFAEKFAIPLPGRLPQFHNYKVMKLPSVETKSSVYRRYIEANEETAERHVHHSTFRKLWAKFCPYITTMKPADDLCDICQQNSIIVQRSFNRPSSEQEEKLKAALDHLERARIQRSFYQDWCKESSSAHLILSFDYAQNISYPSSPLQCGSSYFKAARKCSIFGIKNEITKIQTNFLVDEEFEVGKGPNAVVSQLHHYLEINPSENLVLFCDNCVAQNKNNCMIHYLSWRVMSGFNNTISLNFLLTGHTKFSPDRSFGLIKMEYSKSAIDCYSDFEACVKRSSYNGYNEVENGKYIEWRQWDRHFLTAFKPLIGITQYHHFFFDNQNVRCKRFANSEEENFQLRRRDISLPESLPPTLSPEGLSLERQWYLYDNVRMLCTDPVKRDLVAPKPSQPKKSTQKKKSAQKQKLPDSESEDDVVVPKVDKKMKKKQDSAPPKKPRGRPRSGTKK